MKGWLEVTFSVGGTIGGSLRRAVGTDWPRVPAVGEFVRVDDLSRHGMLRIEGVVWEPNGSFTLLLGTVFESPAEGLTVDGLTARGWFDPYS